jgi:hypothetical protein
MSYFVWTTKKSVSRSTAAEIDKAVKAIDPSMGFVRYHAAGNDTRGWLERPNDGTNTDNHVRARNAECARIAESLCE